jgi:hypothetical protein
MKPWVVYSLAVVALCVVCPALIGFLVGAALVFSTTWVIFKAIGG